MRKRILLWIGVAMVSAFVVASVASAQGVLTLSASPTAVTYPHSTRLTVTFPDSGPATATILAMPVGSSTWTTLTVVATTATPSVSVKPLMTTAYEAVVGDVVSAPATVTVAAKLSKPVLPASIHRRRAVTVKGTMSPREIDGTVTVSFYHIETVLKKNAKGKVRKSTEWVLHSSVDVALTSKNSQTSTWSLRWKPTELGYWKIVVAHEDAAYARSSMSTLTRVRR